VIRVAPPHDFLDVVGEMGFRFSVGYKLTEGVRRAILATPEPAWTVRVTLVELSRACSKPGYAFQCRAVTSTIRRGMRSSWSCRYGSSRRVSASVRRSVCARVSDASSRV
jgi:hypothetical protein